VGNGGFETGDFTDWNMAGNTNLVFALSADDLDVAGREALPGASDGLFVHSGLYGAYLGEFAWEGSPAMGSLSQAVATKPGQEYLVSFWLTSIALEGQTNENEFVASWNGSTLYAQTNLQGMGWTNLQFAVPATAKSTTLEFDFNNNATAFGLDDVSVETVPGPVLQSATITGTSITFTWSGVPNSSYQIQSASDLSHPNWTNVTGGVIAPGDPMSASQPIGAASQQYFRVIQLPAP
jgi:hypothetical protein